MLTKTQDTQTTTSNGHRKDARIRARMSSGMATPHLGAMASSAHILIEDHKGIKRETNISGETLIAIVKFFTPDLLVQAKEAALQYAQAAHSGSNNDENYFHGKLMAYVNAARLIANHNSREWGGDAEDVKVAEALIVEAIEIDKNKREAAAALAASRKKRS